MTTPTTAQRLAAEGIADLPHVGGVRAGDFSSLVVFNHSALGRAGDFPYERKKGTGSEGMWCVSAPESISWDRSI